MHRTFLFLSKENNHDWTPLRHPCQGGRRRRRASRGREGTQLLLPGSEQFNEKMKIIVSLQYVGTTVRHGTGSGRFAIGSATRGDWGVSLDNKTHAPFVHYHLTLHFQHILYCTGYLLSSLNPYNQSKSYSRQQGHSHKNLLGLFYFIPS